MKLLCRFCYEKNISLIHCEEGMQTGDFVEVDLRKIEGAGTQFLLVMLIHSHYRILFSVTKYKMVST